MSHGIPEVVPGLEELLSSRDDLLRHRRIALLANQASVDRQLHHAADLLAAAGDLVTLFGPEHGLRGEAQDMESTTSGTDPGTGLPVHSLYGATADTLAPSAQMLAGLDVLVCDLQDVGSRYYTFAATLLHVLDSVAGTDLTVVVTDRPNPLGGMILEGPGLDEGYESFVGRLDVPVRHGLTMGEMALLYRRRAGLDVDLQVIPMQGWRRDMLWQDCRLPWVLPSPNMPTYDTATIYPGGCLVEGTHLSEGRGTTRPFEFVGAPWLDAEALAGTLNRHAHPGLSFRPHWFRPLAQKCRGETCAGVQVHIEDAAAVRSFAAYVDLIIAARAQDAEKFSWRTEAYEFETRHPAIDLLAGSERLRRDIEAGRELDEMVSQWAARAEPFLNERRDLLLYPEP
jgi:uncharacterized protein YbbC (DUF1343 family)